MAVLARGDTALRDSVNAILRSRMRDGSLEKTFRAWGVWSDTEARYFEAALAAAPAGAADAPREARSVRTYLPALLRAAVITLPLGGPCGP